MQMKKLGYTGKSKAFLLVTALVIAAGSTAWGGGKQEAKYPTKPIELIVSFSAGGGTDLVGRALAESLKGILKQDVVVVNKTGGGGSVGMMEGLNAKPDGYTITLFTREVVSLPILGQAPFKTFDFRFIGNVNVDPPMVVVNSKSKYKKIEDLLADIKANPEKLVFAASVVPNFYGIQLAQTANIKFTTVPFLGAAPRHHGSNRRTFRLRHLRAWRIESSDRCGESDSARGYERKEVRRLQRCPDLQGNRP